MEEEIEFGEENVVNCNCRCKQIDFYSFFEEMNKNLKKNREIQKLSLKEFAKSDEIVKQSNYESTRLKNVLDKMNSFMNSYIEMTGFKLILDDGRNHKLTDFNRLITTINNDDDNCYFCGYRGRLHKHHMVKRKDGGLDEENNLIKICPNCHTTIHGKGYKLRFDDGKIILINKELKKFIFPYREHINEIREIPKNSILNALNNDVSDYIEW